MAYTEEQKSTIEYLVGRGKSIHRRITESTDKFERERLQDELNYVKAELNDVMNAEARFNACLKLADKYIDKAEAIRKKWLNK